MNGKTLSVVPTLARRFLLSRASDGFLSLIAWVSVVGVALGVLALTVVTSVINGFEGELARVITGMNGELVLYSRAEPVSDPELIEAKIRKVVPETQAITRSFVTEVMAAGPSGVAGSVLEGVDGATLGEVTAVPRRVVSGRLPTSEGEVALCTALADRIGAVEGSEIRLIVPFSGDALAAQGSKESEGLGGAPQIIKVQVVGLVRMGMYEYDSQFIFAALPAVQSFLKQGNKVTSFKMRLAPGTDSQVASDHLTDHFGYPFRAKNWAQMNKNLFYAIKLEKVVIAIIMTVIVIVAAFNVVSTLMMMIHDKSKEIAILKAMGFRPAQSFQLFCLIGVGMGAVGTAVGVFTGLGLNWLLEKTHWIDLPPDIYYIGFLPVVVRWSEVALIALSAILISFMATLYPGWQVCRRSPLEGLRYE
ncbi:FtsX-like permease family protein [Bdellovibrionota bacterium FG-1]